MGVLFINTALNLDNELMIKVVPRYFYSLCSYAVPLLFMICAYQYAQSSCHIKHLKKALLKYSKYLIITAILNFLILEIDFKLSDAVLMNHNAIAYFWFIKILLLFQLFILALYIFNEGLLSLLLILILLSKSEYAISSDMIIYFTYFLIGYYYKKSKFALNRYLPKVIILISLLTPFIINYQYETVNIYIFVTSFFIFNAIIKMRDLNGKILKFYGYRSLEAVFFQYFIIEILKKFNLEINLVIKYVIVVLITTSCVYGYTKLYQQIQNKYFKKLLSNI